MEFCPSDGKIQSCCALVRFEVGTWQDVCAVNITERMPDRTQVQAGQDAIHLQSQLLGRLRREANLGNMTAPPVETYGQKKICQQARYFMVVGFITAITNIS